MRLFSNPRNLDRAKWLLVLLLGITVIYLTKQAEIFPFLGQILKAAVSSRFFFA